MKRNLLLTCLFAVSSALACAQTVTQSVITPGGRVSAGTVIPVEVVSFNRGEVPSRHVPAEQLRGTLTVGSNSWPVVLRAEAVTPHEIGAGSFAAARYLVELPKDAQGRGVLDLAVSPGQSIAAVLDIKGSARSSRPALIGPAAGASLATVATADAQATLLGRTFAGRMAAHEPIYFIYGDETQAAKFQFSFKYRLATFGEGTAERAPTTLQFGYTQRSLWDLDADSSPFYDTSYMPELFWEWLNFPATGENELFSWNGFQIGGKHESNGRDGFDSRSLNTGFVRTIFTIGRMDGWHVVLVPEIWQYVGGLGGNEDLDEYRGYGQLRAIIGKADGPMLMFTGATGKEFDHGSVQLDLTVPVHTQVMDMSMFFLVQYFNGYGESLRSYDQKSESLRAGFSFLR